MKKLFIILMTSSCLMWAISVQAHQITSIESMRLVGEGVLKNTRELTQIALSEHSGSELRADGELKQIYGRYVYRVALLDTKKIKWNVDLDAETGKVISNMID